jgi:hypothetical protein
MESRAAQLHITGDFTLINDQQFVAGDLLLEAKQLLLVAGLDQLTDQRGSSGEAHPMAALAGSQAQSQSDMRFPRAARDRNIMPIVRRRSRFTTSGIRYVGRIYVCVDAFSCRWGSISLASFRTGPLVDFQHG